MSENFPQGSVLTGKTPVVHRGCLWEQRDGLGSEATSYQRSHC